jgi:PTH1 family peptidyl-tRNA hydrolase
VRLLPRRREAHVDLLVAALGNPGPRYRATRHNLGFRVADELARRHDAQPARDKHGGALQELRLPDGETLALLRPLEYMNVSGGPVAKAARAYGLSADAVVVVHDDLESPFGRVRAKQGGGLAGHNGLRSIAERLATREFARVRLGIGRPGRGDVRGISDWVLSPFEVDEDPEPMIAAGADCVELIAREGIEAALAAFA